MHQSLDTEIQLFIKMILLFPCLSQARLLTHHAAALIDAHGNKAARAEVAMIKVAAPQMAQQVIDRAIQIHGGAGLSDDTFLAHAFAWARILRLADGPDEVHLASIAKRELRNRRQQLDHVNEIKG